MPLLYYKDIKEMKTINKISKLISSIKKIIFKQIFQERFMPYKYNSPRLQPSVEKEKELMRKALKTANLRKILDIGSGDGRVALELLKLGARPDEIVLLDINEDNLKQALKRFGDSDYLSRKTFFLKSNFIKYSTEEKFDLIISLGTVFSLAKDFTIKEGLLRVKEILEPKGLFLFSLISKEFLVEHSKKYKPVALDLIKEKNIYENWNKIYGEGIFECFGETKDILNKIENLGFEIITKEYIEVDFKGIPQVLIFLVKQKMEE